MHDERRVLIVDDHRSFAEALAFAIDAHPGLRCVAIAGSGSEGLAAAEETAPDAALVDMRLPDLPGPTLVARLRSTRPRLAILALTAYADAANLAAATQAGASAYLRKECSVRDIVATLRRAEPGQVAIDPDTLSALMRRSTRPAPIQAGTTGHGFTLTPREHEVLELLAQGQDVQGITSRLGISVHTTRGYVKALLAKLDAHTQLELVVRARNLGIVHDPPAGPPQLGRLTVTGMLSGASASVA